jgi:hypothetical protein
MRPVAVWLFPVASLACAPAPATPAQPPEPAATSAASAPSPALMASASAAVPPAAAPEPPAAPLPPAVKPLTEAEQKEAERLCRPLMAAIQQRKKAGAGGNPAEVLEQVLGKPPAMGKVELARCAELLRRGIGSYLQAAIETEARVTVRQIGRSMAAAYEREDLAGSAAGHQLCPSAPPVPADLEAVRGKPHAAAASEWEAPGWKCLQFQLTGGQRFQYEVRTAGKRFVIFARAPSLDGTRIIEFRQPGGVTAKDEVGLEDVERAELARGAGR